MKFILSFVILASVAAISVSSPLLENGLSPQEKDALDHSVVMYYRLVMSDEGESSWWSWWSSVEEMGKEALMRMAARVFTPEFWQWFKEMGSSVSMEMVEKWIEDKFGFEIPMAAEAIQWLRNGGFETLKKMYAHYMSGKTTEEALILAEGNHNPFMDWAAEQAMKGFLKSMVPEDLQKFLQQDGVQEKIQLITHYLQDHFGNNPMVKSLINWVHERGQELLSKLAKDMLNGATNDNNSGNKL